MTKYENISTAEKLEYQEAWGNEFNLGLLTETRYRESLARLGLNATDIEDEIEKYHP